MGTPLEDMGRIADAIDSAREMEGKTSEEQSRRAILHTLRRIHEHPGVGYYCGYGTQTFSLLTEAYATLTGEPVERIREHFHPKAPADPAAAARDEALRSKRVKVCGDDLRSLREAVALLEELENADVLASCTNTDHRTLDLMRSGERKGELAGRLRSLAYTLEEHE